MKSSFYRLFAARGLAFSRSQTESALRYRELEKAFTLSEMPRFCLNRTLSSGEKSSQICANKGNLGTQLKLVCQNHPQNFIQASSADDFENAPEGGCGEPCQFGMPDCEHICQSFCHPIDVEHKEEFACQMPCARSCDSDHRCPKICSEDCGPCMVKIPKTIPECEHEQEVPCSMHPSEFKCKQMVKKKALPCGHVNSAECSMAADEIKCKKPCGVLECGHPCQGKEFVCC